MKIKRLNQHRTLTQKYWLELMRRKNNPLTAIERNTDIKKVRRIFWLDNSNQNKIILPFQEEISKLQGPTLYCSN
jgi:hypothetical protein